jgi:carbon starvation protein
MSASHGQLASSPGRRYVMTAYIFLACALPLWLILQPREFTNVQLLYGGQTLLFLSVIITGLQGRTMQAPATDIAGGER